MLILLYPLSNIEITKCFNYERTFNGAFSRNNLPRIKDVAYIINLNDRKVKGHIGLHCLLDRSTAVCFDSFGIEYIPQEVFTKIKGKSITHSIFRIQDGDSILSGFYCITIIEYMLHIWLISCYSWWY